MSLRSWFIFADDVVFVSLYEIIGVFELQTLLWPHVYHKHGTRSSDVRFTHFKNLDISKFNSRGGLWSSTLTSEASKCLTLSIFWNQVVNNNILLFSKPMGQNSSFKSLNTLKSNSRRGIYMVISGLGIIWNQKLRFSNTDYCIFLISLTQLPVGQF